MKPTVQYYAFLETPTIGSFMFVKTRDHPSSLVTNYGDGWVRTSPVVSITSNGFETTNTRYEFS